MNEPVLSATPAAALRQRVIWTEGMFLRPQHFQQLERHWERYVGMRCLPLQGFYWGYDELQIDRELLALGKVALLAATGVMRDGTPFDLSHPDDRPEPLDVPADAKDQLVVLALPRGGGTTGMRLAPVEGEHLTLPTAIFFNTDESTREYGRAALASYIDGFDGRLMRSMKSILGSPLAETTTDLGDGSAIAYTDVIALFLMHLKQKAEACAGGAIGCAVLGRPVFFVDDDPRADRLAQQQLEAAAHAVGLADVQFQYEPIAAAFDYESRQDDERLVLVADIGGGTSDFSLVRVGPERMRRL